MTNITNYVTNVEMVFTVEKKDMGVPRDEFLIPACLGVRGKKQRDPWQLTDIS